MKIIADQDLCIGSGNCVLSDPDVFDQSDDGLVELLDAEPDSGHDEAISIAVRRCPSGALSLAD